MADLKPVYLISGDDDPKIDAWRARVRARAEAEGGAGALERFEGRESSPEAVAVEAASMTLGGGPRYLLVEDAGAWKAADLEPIERAIADPAPDTVLVLIVRGKPIPRLLKAVEDGGGEIREHLAPKSKQLPGWVVGRARERGLSLDGETAKALVARVGNRPAQLLRELEKLALAVHPATRLSAADVEELASGEAGAGVYDLADTLASGDRSRTLAQAESLIAREGKSGGLTYPLVRRLREVHQASRLLDAGLPEQQVAGALPVPPWIAKRMVALARGASREGLELAICAFADLEARSRSGEGLDEATELSLTLARATA